MLRLGLAHHLGWAVAVTASGDHAVVDRRRIELVEEGLPNAPVHHEGGPHRLHRKGEPLADEELAGLVARVRASAVATAGAELDRLVESLEKPITSMHLRAWPAGFPTGIAEQRRVPYESRADSVMYRQVLAELAAARGWEVVLYDKGVEDDAARLLGARADQVLRGPGKVLGPPWTKDHRTALAATVVGDGSAASGS